MKKTIAVIALSTVALFSAACSGSKPSAESLYKDYVSHYGYVAEAFGVPIDDSETFESYAASLDDCEPIDGETAALTAVLIGATLQEHGDDVATFVKDTNELLAAVKAEGLCGTAAPTSPVPTPPIYIDPPTTTTTSNPYLYGSEAADLCYGEAWDGLVDLSDKVVALAEAGGSYLTAESRATINDALQTMQETVNVCRGVVSPDFTANSQDLVDATKRLVNLHTSS